MVHELPATQATSADLRFKWERELLPGGVICEALKKKTRKYQATVNLARALVSFSRSNGSGIFASEATVGGLCGGIKQRQVRNHLTILRSVGALATEFRWNSPLRYRLLIPASSVESAHPSTTTIKNRSNTAAYQEGDAPPAPLVEHDQDSLDHLDTLRAVGGSIRPSQQTDTAPAKRLTDDQAKRSVVNFIEAQRRQWATAYQEAKKEAELAAHRACVVPIRVRPLSEAEPQLDGESAESYVWRRLGRTQPVEDQDQGQKNYRADLMELIRLSGTVEFPDTRLIAEANTAAINYFQRAIYEGMTQEERNDWYLTDYRNGNVWTFPEPGVSVS